MHLIEATKSHHTNNYHTLCSLKIFDFPVSLRVTFSSMFIHFVELEITGRKHLTFVAQIRRTLFKDNVVESKAR